MTDQQKYPLAWPVGQPRTDYRMHARFGTRGMNTGNGWRQTKSLTIAQAMDRLRHEVKSMGVDFEDDCIVSSNLKLNMSGLPRSDQGEPTDPGVAVYWISENGPRVMAIDLYKKVADNIAAVARTLEYMRGIERHGGKHIQERAFTGFTALPPPESCWKILGMDRIIVDRMRTKERFPGEVKQLVVDFFKQRVRETHGTGADMDRLVKARDEALKEIGAK
jgi:hypothetical protein